MRHADWHTRVCIKTATRIFNSPNPMHMLKILVVCISAVVMCAAITAQAAPLAARTPQSADLIVILKSDRLLYVYRDGLPIHKYPIQLGGAPVGPKRREGDSRTPEGAYKLDWRNPTSIFYKSIHITYPNARDRERAVRLGVSPGSAIMIHGQPSYDSRTRYGDWTHGCIAVSNKAMDELWELVPEDTPIHIYP